MSNEILVLVIIGWAYLSHLISSFGTALIAAIVVLPDYKQFSKYSPESFFNAIKEVKPSYYWTTVIGIHVVSMFFYTWMIHLGLTLLNDSLLVEQRVNAIAFTIGLIGARICWISAKLLIKTYSSKG